MSFRLFIFYCTLCGAWAAFIGWALGRPANLDAGLKAGVRGMFLGLLVALALGIVDALWNYSLRQFGSMLLRILVIVAVGSGGGFAGGYIAQALYDRTNQTQDMFLVVGWTLTGLLIGTAIGAYDYLACLLLGRDRRGARRKLLNGIIGGTSGGLLGGLLYNYLDTSWARLFKDKAEALQSPSAIGFVVLGACIGLLIGLAQVILKEAWIRVEAGFRRGRELILSKPETTIGRAESCDIGLFGDPNVERLHARIVRLGRRYLIADAGTTGGTYLNDERVVQPVPLQSGDAIRLGNCILRFSERRKG
jgi:hypothetical protein